MRQSSNSFLMKKSMYLNNRAVLKSAERWIVAAYVWKLLYFPFSWIVSPRVMPIEQLRPIFFSCHRRLQVCSLWGYRLPGFGNHCLHQAPCPHQPDIEESIPAIHFGLYRWNCTGADKCGNSYRQLPVRCHRLFVAALSLLTIFVFILGYLFHSMLPNP